MLVASRSEAQRVSVLAVVPQHQPGASEYCPPSSLPCRGPLAADAAEAAELAELARVAKVAAAAESTASNLPGQGVLG